MWEEVVRVAGGPVERMAGYVTLRGLDLSPQLYTDYWENMW
jgi:hypothetical protein